MSKMQTTNNLSLAFVAIFLVGVSPNVPKITRTDILLDLIKVITDTTTVF